MHTVNLKRLTYVTAGMSIVAGLIHGLVTPEHFAEWWGYGLFFFVATFAQVAYGVLLLLRPWAYDTSGGERNDVDTDRRTILFYAAGIVGNLVIIGLWMVTRTAGIPFFGPGAGEVEQVTLISLASKLVEAALIVCLAWMIQRMRATSHGTGVTA